MDSYDAEGNERASRYVRDVQLLILSACELARSALTPPERKLTAFAELAQRLGANSSWLVFGQF